MSQGCNFINSWMYASRRRSASVTRPTSNSVSTPTTTTSTTTNSTESSGRRASSSNDLVTQISAPLVNKSSSNNHLVPGSSLETICSIDSTQTSRRPEGEMVYMTAADMMQPIQINIYSENNPSERQESHYNLLNNESPISLSDILQIDMDSMRLEDECKNLESKVDYMEQRIDELERKRFDDDVPRTLVENVLKQRRRLRELDFQLYKLSIETEESEKLSQILSPNDTYSLHNNKRIDSPIYTIQDDNFSTNHGRLFTSSKYGSNIQPGQENTADILDAIPPSGSLQHKQYLSRASTGTDSSDYSQLPAFELHKHPLPQLQKLTVVPCNESISSSNYVSHEDLKDRRHIHHHHKRKERNYYENQPVRKTNQVDNRQQQEQSVYVQFVDQKLRSENRQSKSPVRPDHFKSDFSSNNMIVTRDSSSTASSSSPH